MKDLQELFSVRDKKVIITGAAKENGLGAHMAISMKHLGALVLILDVDERVRKTADKNGLLYEICDISNPAGARAGFEAAVSKLNGIDVLINCAGTQHRCAADAFPAEDWERVLRVNLSATFFMCQLAAKHMREQGSGKIINISSISGFIGPKNMAAYAASKGGVIQLTKALSTEWSGLGINVNSIAPGTTVTDFTKDIIDTPQGQGMLSRIPMKRFGKPEDIVGAAVFLSSAASDYITGVTIPVDGGSLAN